MRILILSQWFTPEPFFKGLSFARALRERGHEVHVLTGFPNYPEGRLYQGYHLSVHHVETRDGIRIHRVPLYASHNGNPLHRIANYTSFAISSAFLGPAVMTKADVAYVYHPPATVALAAMMLRFVRGIPYVYDVQDLWPDTLAATGMLTNRVALALVGLWCESAYRLAARIIVLSPGFKKALIERGVPPKKIEVIYNWCEEDAVRKAVPELKTAQELGLAGKFNIVFAGTMGKAQSLSSVLDGAGLIQNELPQVQFVFVGGGIEVESLKSQAAISGLRNVLFLPRRPPNEIGEILGLADALLVHLADDSLFRITVPSKTQAYMSVGRPILMGVKGDAADLVNTARAGMCFEPANPNSLLQAIRSIVALSPEERDQLGVNGRAFYQTELSMKVGVGQFERVFQKVAEENRNGSGLCPERHTAGV